MTSKKSSMSAEAWARTISVALEYRKRNRARINAKQNAKRAASRPDVDPATVAAKKADKAARDAARKTAWAEKNAEHVKAKRKAQYEREKATAIAKAVEWNRQNKDRRKAIVAAYSEANPDQRRAVKARRRARANAAPGSYTKQDVRDILDRQRWECAACAISLRGGYEVDHIQPLSRGGSNWPSNLQALCMPCNRSKGAREPAEFVRYVAAPS